MKIMVFENDADFEFFAITPVMKVKKIGDRTYSDWDFTQEYLDESDAGTLFFIKDRNSKIVRRHSCVFNIIAKPVKNVSAYNELICGSSNPAIEIVNF